MITVSVCLHSDALLQHLPSYLGFLTLDKGYLLTAAPPDLECGVAPLGPPVPDDHYIYYCGQESLRRIGAAIMVKKESEVQYLDAVSKMTE